MKRLIIIGAGGFGREVLSWSTTGQPPWQIKGFLDDDPRALADRSLGVPMLGSIDGYEPVEEDVFLCAIGQPALRRSTFDKIHARGGRFATLVHPTAVVADRAKLEEGVIICPFALVSVDARVEAGAVIYYHSSVDHDAVVGRWCQVSGHCDITGAATLGTEVFLGSHAAIMPGVHVGDRAVVGAGAVVIADVKPGTTVIGVPARERQDPSRHRTSR
ncbi:MAG: acetyltransferase [Opitutaceae bacterium]|nr:acetyltransferase [Opitutaceae bacterium]